MMLLLALNASHGMVAMVEVCESLEPCALKAVLSCEWALAFQLRNTLTDDENASPFRCVRFGT